MKPKRTPVVRGEVLASGYAIVAKLKYQMLDTKQQVRAACRASGRLNTRSTLTMPLFDVT